MEEKRAVSDSLKLQRQMFFNKTSCYCDLVEGNIEAEKLLIFAKGKKFNIFDNEQDEAWVRNFKNSHKSLAHTLSKVENLRKNSLDLFLSEKESLTKKEKQKFTERNLSFKAQIATTHLIIEKMIRLENEIDPNDEA